MLAAEGLGRVEAFKSFVRDVTEFRAMGAVVPAFQLLDEVILEQINASGVSSANTLNEILQQFATSMASENYIVHRVQADGEILWIAAYDMGTVFGPSSVRVFASRDGEYVLKETLNYPTEADWSELPLDVRIVSEKPTIFLTAFGGSDTRVTRTYLLWEWRKGKPRLLLHKPKLQHTSHSVGLNSLEIRYCKETLERTAICKQMVRETYEVRKRKLRLRFAGPL